MQSRSFSLGSEPRPESEKKRSRGEKEVWGKEENAHIVMLAQIAQISIQLFNPLFMCLDPFAFEAFVELQSSGVEELAWVFSDEN